MAKKGERPQAIVNHRYEWLYVYGFVKPKTGETLWYLIPRVNTEWLNLVYETFAIEANVGQTRIFLVEDNAGWHKSHSSKDHTSTLLCGSLSFQAFNFLIKFCLNSCCSWGFPF